LGQLPEEPFEWLVPGLLEEKIAALIRGLPKDTRRHFVPAPQFARAVRESLSPTPSESLFVAIARELKRMTGITVTSSQWDVEKLSTHLRMRFVIVNERAKVLATGRNLLGLRETLTGETKQAFSQTAATTADTAWAAREVKDWDFGDLPQSIEVGRGGLRLLAYPALTAEQGRLELRLFETAEAAEAALKLGLRALIRQHLTQNLKYLEKNLPRIQEMCLYYTSLGSCADLRADLVTAVIDEVFLSEPLPRCREDFEARLETGRNQLMVSANRLIGLIAPALAEYHQLMKQLQASKSPALKPVISDIHRQLERLIYPGFIATTPTIWRPRLVVYLKAARLRIEKIGGRLAKDQEHQHILERWQSRYEGLGKAKSAKNPACEQLRWLLEEYRISLFAQELGAATRVSEKRLEELMGDFQN
jgi:ATP-dependent helicase HrpA